MQATPAIHGNSRSVRVVPPVKDDAAWRATFDRAAREEPRFTRGVRHLRDDVAATLRRVVPSDARVLEVGCGRGGGAAFLTALHTPARYTAVDFSPAAVALAARLHAAAAPRLSFAVGDAERLAFGDASFDVVVNVESSHCYGDVPAFLREMARVLAPGGRFAFADFRGTADCLVLEAQLRAAGGTKTAGRVET